MQFEVPNCDNGTKSCHCGEGSWIRGAKAWNSELGKRMKDTWALFYKTGSFDDLLSWADLDYDKFNVIGEDKWTSDAILDWSERDILDEIHEHLASYTWCQTKPGYY